MSNRKNLVAVGTDAENTATEATETAPPSEGEAARNEIVAPLTDWVEEDEPSQRLGRFDWIVPALAVLAVLGWTGFFAWVHQQAIFGGASAAQWSEWVVAWSVPVLLVVVICRALSCRG